MFRIFIAFFLCTLQTIGFSQRQSGLQVNLKFEKDTFEFLEPWSFEVRLVNTSSADLKVAVGHYYQGTSTNNCEIKIEMLDATENKWIDLELISSIWTSAPTDFAILNLHHPYLRLFDCAPPLHLEGITGRIKVRASYSAYYSGPDSLKYYSDPTEITILSLPQKDEAAFKYIKASFKKPQTIFYPLLWVGSDTSNITPVKYLLEHFPESAFADYAILHLTVLYKIKFIRERAEKAENSRFDYLRIAKQYALKGLLSKNAIIAERSKNSLSSIANLIIGVYSPVWPPEELLSEFEFDFRDK